MPRKLNVYDLNNSYYLYGDVESTIDRIGELYEINFFKTKIEFISKIKYPQNVSWVSDEATKSFNDTIPVIKSLIKDIYALIEGIFIAKTGKFEKLQLEKKYAYLKELREFNNKLKHHNTKNITFKIISIINTNSKTLDCMVQYKYKDETELQILLLTKFFEVFFLILEGEEVISIDRK
tara:strand:+ start:7775 stop:8311 length:537 start_codon:yes stop_codon:yes gene_type:complete